MKGVGVYERERERERERLSCVCVCVCVCACARARLRICKRQLKWPLRIISFNTRQLGTIVTVGRSASAAFATGNIIISQKLWKMSIMPHERTSPGVTTETEILQCDTIEAFPRQSQPQNSNTAADTKLPIPQFSAQRFMQSILNSGKSLWQLIMSVSSKASIL